MIRLAPIVLLAVTLSHAARADAPPPSTPAPPPEFVRGQRFVGLGAEIGLNTGIGPALHLGLPQFGLYAAAGLMPIFIVGNEQNASRSLTFDVYRAFELNVDFYAMFIKGSPRADLGVSGGYSGNTLLGNGFNLGIAARYDLGEKLAFSLFGGLEYFPDARNHLFAHNYPTTQDAASPELQGGINLGIVFYP